MGDLAIDTAVEGRDGRYTANLSRDWEIWGPNGGYVAAIALRAAGAHSRFDRPASLVGHFLGVGDFEQPLEIETTTLREAKRAQSIRVSMTQSGQAIFDAMVWSVGDVSGLEHDFAPMPDVPDPETIPSTEERMAARGDDAPPPFPFWLNFDGRQPNWIDDWENRERRRPGCRRLVPVPAALDVRRSVGRRMPLGHPARHAGLARRVRAPRAARVHRAQHRPVGGVPPVAARGAVALRRRDRVERGRRNHRVREPRVGAGPNPARRRRQPAPLPPRPPVLTASRSDASRRAKCSGARVRPTLSMWV